VLDVKPFCFSPPSPNPKPFLKIRDVIPFFEGKGEKALGKDYLGVAASTKARIFFLDCLWKLFGNFPFFSNRKKRGEAELM